MGGVDAFDAVVFGSSLARKCNKWPVRVIEHTASFLLTNSKTAFAINHKKDLTKYTNKQYSLDVLRGSYASVKNVSKIEYEFKLSLPIRKRCLWDSCKKTTLIYCNNDGCKKYACRDHLLPICNFCFSDNVLKNANVKRTNLYDHIQKRCAVIGCAKNSKIACACCNKKFCPIHRASLCVDCSMIHYNSDGHTNFSHKFKSRKKAL